ncbi:MULTISPECIES: rod shape-determining protein MreC [unclassified Candidatus Frackibacter]|uniref:rod shape-determining protein MreC n=1 Tax=unclassified Candidatus Frackibacter TaxID=2648818 RepID=UPI000883F9A1|nr:MULTISPECIES: rod shape-determining protein MreC [unclassified Candidatus Frackibacter]SDC40641.1 rod shape-determining protein MreC [Candidatus Frackibacter sp. WG11]SEM60187.1 rod shape-determining protein MreC [Candidatus Frackibacter sp. WG12]SFL61832.1 rod shape-determining protein MreC [Candidatus Frackibacter sp. WG13]
MAGLFKKHHRFILILVMLILILTLVNLVGAVAPEKDWGEGLVIDAVAPFLGVINWVNDTFNDTLNVLLNYKEVKEENNRLQKKVKKLNWKIHQLNETAKLNDRLRELLEFKIRKPFTFIGAKVIGKSADNWSQIVTINRGSKSGLEPKMLVVTYNGYLVGRVEQVSTYSAQVLLLNDSNFTIGGLIAKKESREIGIVNGSLAETDLLKMNKLPWDANVEVGDKVITSGLSKLYPKGVLIGKVVKVEPEDYGLTHSARLKPFVDLGTFEEVLVITDF